MLIIEPIATLNANIDMPAEHTSAGMSAFPKHTPIGMSYVPFQQWDKTVYEPNIALSRGTIFPELDLPFIGEEAVPSGSKG